MSGSLWNKTWTTSNTHTNMSNKEKWESINPVDVVQEVDPNTNGYAIPEFEKIPFVVSGGIPGYRLTTSDRPTSMVATPLSPIREDVLFSNSAGFLGPGNGFSGDNQLQWADITTASRTGSRTASRTGSRTASRTGSRTASRKAAAAAPPLSLVAQDCYDQMKSTLCLVDRGTDRGIGESAAGQAARGGYLVRHPTECERSISRHIDFFFAPCQNAAAAGAAADYKSIKVLPRQKIRCNDQEKQDDFFWILLHDIKPNDMGYLHDAKLDYLAQEVLLLEDPEQEVTPSSPRPFSSSYFLFERRRVKDFVLDKLPLSCINNDLLGNSNVTTRPSEAIYKILKIGKRNDIKTLVPREDLMPLCVGKIPAFTTLFSQ